MHFQDLDLCRYHRGPLDADSWRAPLLAVGWLEHPHEFGQGPTPDGLIERLNELILDAGEEHPQHSFRGLHCCSLCALGLDIGRGLPSSHINILVPGRGAIFAAPGGIVHYIEMHSYLPPQDFIAAVAACPTYGSPEYYDALQAANAAEKPPIETRAEMEEERRALLASLQARGRVQNGSA